MSQTSAPHSAATIVELLASDLPASCPNPNMSAWNSHPRVFIDVSHGHATCPYCGTEYRLKAGEIVKGH
ncbi:zinc-finger domain-containing protein [Hydromonas duriensis]|uniref:zinc-finger domain-containing protein n=1 Tax=Hydromonas duriensis TaxID=1527608 RepID=UPI00105C16DA|nr:zinc-finger domain-containing protein [Hydromonas duriensis]